MNKGMQKILFVHNAFENETVESAWAKSMGEYYKLDNILFYAKEYSWKDIVKVQEINGELWVKALIEESGHSTIRILFKDKKDVKRTRKELKELNCSSELSNIDILISVDIPPNVSYINLKEYLEQGTINKFWEYEEACISSIHKNEFNEFFEIEDPS